MGRRWEGDERERRLPPRRLRRIAAKKWRRLITGIAMAVSVGVGSGGAVAQPNGERDAGEPAPSAWVAVAKAGLGDAKTEVFTPFAEFRGALYLGGLNTAAGCQLWRSADGDRWDVVVGPGAATPSGFGNPRNTSINTLLAFGERLYAGTWNQDDGAQLWRSADGLAWEAIVGGEAPMGGGFGKQENSGITALAAFHNMLFAGTSSLYCKDGVELWLSRDGGQTWEAVAGERIALQTALARESKYFLDLKEFRGALYVATGDQRTGGSEIWRTEDGRRWDAVVGAPSPYRAGMGHPDHDMIYELETFHGYLYAGVFNFARTGGALWRSPDGSTWEIIAGDDRSPYPAGFGDPANIGLTTLEPFHDRLYVGTTNEAGGQLWMSADGRQWQQVVGPGATIPAGFGNAHNRAIKTLHVFRGRLYAGIHNTQEGAELWRSVHFE